MHIDGKVIFNLNDCPIDNKKTITSFKDRHGGCDILLTQFSYAAWKGGRLNEKWRIEAARNKLETIKLQSDILNPSIIIPFASFIYFANEENFYLNDHSNKINSLIDYNNKYGLNFVIMKPYETQVLEHISQSDESIEFWQNIYKDLDNKPKFNFEKTIDEIEIFEAFSIYQKKIFKKKF